VSEFLGFQGSSIFVRASRVKFHLMLIWEVVDLNTKVINKVK